MSKWKMVKLGEVCDINMGQSPNSESYNEENDGIPFYQGNADFGTIYPKLKYYCNKPTKIANKYDVLLSVRAPIGALNIAIEKCCIGRGLCAITQKEKLSYFKYIYYVLRLKKNELNAKGTGSTFKAINKKNLLGIEIPLPPLDIQKHIADTLAKTQEIIDGHKKQLEELDNLIKAIFYDMFGDPVTNERGWDLLQLFKLGELGRGVSKHRPRNAPELLGGNYPLIQTGDVANADLYIDRFSQTYSEEGFKQSKLWEKGTLCITIAANIAKTAILGFNACFPDSIVGFNANTNTNNIFIHYWFGFFQAILEAQAPESAQKNINLRILNDLKVIVPPLDLQNKFAQIVTKIEQQKSLVKQSIKESQNLFDSLMSKYFD